MKLGKPENLNLNPGNPLYTTNTTLREVAKWVRKQHKYTMYISKHKTCIETSSL